MPTQNIRASIEWPDKTFKFQCHNMFRNLTNSFTGIASGTNSKPDLALGASGNSLADRSWHLIQKSTLKALKDLLSIHQNLLKEANTLEGSSNRLDTELRVMEFSLSEEDIKNLAELPFLNVIDEKLRDWLAPCPIPQHEIDAILKRLPSNFVFSFFNELKRNPEFHSIQNYFRELFDDGSKDPLAWRLVRATLIKKINEGVFGQTYSLGMLYVKPDAYFEEPKVLKDWQYLDDQNQEGLKGKPKYRIVVDLHSELNTWLNVSDNQDSIRVISGDPGAGKSTFSNFFAADLAERGGMNVLSIPLHLIDPSQELSTAIGDLAQEIGCFEYNPITDEKPGKRLLLIVDGLDELSQQGKLGYEVAKDFVRKLESLTIRMNAAVDNLKVLITGRPLVIQANESVFLNKRQLLHLTPYCIAANNRESTNHEYIYDYDYFNESNFDDLLSNNYPFVKEEDIEGGENGLVYNGPSQELIPNPILDEHPELSIPPASLIDKRVRWWEKFNEIRGFDDREFPESLNSEELKELTSQPLLNFLVAITFFDKAATEDVSLEEQNLTLNELYRKLINDVFKRDYGSGPLPVVRDMDASQFMRLLQEISVSIWHGNGRTASINQIEKRLLETNIFKFIEPLRKNTSDMDGGISSLLIAFYFKKFGSDKDGQETFEFTHKSFGEFLVALRIRSVIDRISDEISDFENNLDDKGWDHYTALKHYVNTAGKSTIDIYIEGFFHREITMANHKKALRTQETIETLINCLIAKGIPSHLMPDRPDYLNERQLSFYTKVSLLTILRACTKVTKKIARIKWPTPDFAKMWIENLHKSIIGRGNSTVMPDDLFAGIDYSDCDFRFTHIPYGNMMESDFSGADFSFAVFQKANFARSIFENANLQGARFIDSDLSECKLDKALIHGTAFENSNTQLKSLSDAMIIEWTGNLDHPGFSTEIRKSKTKLKKPIRELGFSSKLESLLLERGINCVGDLTTKSKSKIIDELTLNRNDIGEIETKLMSVNACFVPEL